VVLLLVGSNCLDLVLFFTLDHVRWWPRVVCAMLVGLDIWRKKGGMEYGVYGPLWRKFQLIYYQRPHFFDLEGPMPSGRKFYQSVWQREVFCIVRYPSELRAEQRVRG